MDRWAIRNRSGAGRLTGPRDSIVRPYA